MKKQIILTFFLLLTTDLFAKRLFTLQAKHGFPISCQEIFSNSNYENLKSIILADMEQALFDALAICEEETNSECKEVNTYTEALKDGEPSCFAISIVREK